MRRTALALTILLIATFAVAGPAAALHPASASIAIDPSTGLVAGQSVTVSGTGFTPDTGLAAAECKAGPVSTADCDLSHDLFPSAGDFGEYSFDFTVASALNTQNGPVDCTATDGACVIGVAEASDLTTAVTAPISFAPIGPPKGGVLHVPSAPIAGNDGVNVTGTKFTPGATIDTDQCAADATSPDDCDVPTPVAADEDGTWTYSIFVSATLGTQNGGSVDCTVAGACVFGAWDSRDFADTFSTGPLAIAPEVAGTLTVTPSTGLNDGDQVTLSGSGWPAELYVSLSQCNGTGNDAACTNFEFGLTTDDGTFSIPYTVTSVNDSPYFDCETGPCYIVANWYAEDSTISVAQPISFDTTTTSVTSHYTAAELTAVSGAAATLGVSNEQVQYLGSWGLAWVLSITHTSTLTPVPDTGPGTLTTNWLPSEYRFMNAFAGAHGTTIAEFQKTGALFLAYVLALNP